MRFHLPAIPGRSTEKDNSTCAYSQKIRKFRVMMEARGHQVFIYQHKCEPLPFEPELWADANIAQAQAIGKNYRDGDFLCLIAGRCQELIGRRVPGQNCEFGIGYGGVLDDSLKVFESYSWMHTVYAQHSGDAHSVNGNFFDAVIPNYFEVEDFPQGQGGDYLLYMGRMIERKGVHLAADLAKRAGFDLVLAGEGDEVPDYGTHVGNVDPARRAELMGNARALVAPTLYIEPFGGVAVEAQLCGTPVITTDWGAFPETVAQGETGFRCRTMGEFVEATRLVSELDRDTIRQRAISHYSLEAVAPQYESFFDQVSTLDDEGFYSPNPNRMRSK